MKWNTDLLSRLSSQYWADPAGRNHPVVDQEDCDAAVEALSKSRHPQARGHMARLRMIAEGLGLTVPEGFGVSDLPPSDAVIFSGDLGDPHDLDGFVLREGLLFQCGSYDSHAFSMTPEEMRQAVEAFNTPVPVGYSHTPGVLDGKFGEVRALRQSEDGKRLFGTVALSRWFDRLLEDGKRKLSCEWDRLTKRLNKVDLVLNPRVGDAALMAAFSAGSAEAPLSAAERAELLGHSDLGRRILHEERVAELAKFAVDPGDPGLSHGDWLLAQSDYGRMILADRRRQAAGR